MNHFVVSARKYRPPSFDMVVGQDSITTTLKNAIKNNHLAQAFLFCGPRGVGKTTCARILAKTINCENITKEVEACNTCNSCKSFNTNQSLNIYELDAASNNSVDDIRNLVEQVRYAPHQGQFKIYIIDEVHMLSSGAFNAFLKTLEEPPPYAIFILATTEKHKIIPTILSRCQIFDFNRIQVDDIAKHLQYIAKNEGVEAEEDAMHLIALKADGALRDALSIFDQLVSFSGKKITYKDVIQNLNVLDYDYYFRLTQYFLESNVSKALLTFNEIMQDGFDAHQFINGLSSHFRDLMVCQNPSTLLLLDAAPSIREQYKLQSSLISFEKLIHFLELTNSCDIEYRQAKNQRLHVELCLIKLCSTQIISTIHTDIMVKEPEMKYEKTITRPAPIEDKSSIVVSKTPDNTKENDANKTETENQSESGLERETISLKKKSRSNEVVPATVKERISDFSLEALMSAWDELKSVCIKKEKKLLANILENHSPEEQFHPRLYLILDNLVQQEQIKDEQDWMLELLRNKLENDTIVFETHVRSYDEIKKKPYTGQEKFEELAFSNPVLLDLKNQLELDIL